MERIFVGKVIRDTTSPSGYYLRNLQMDKVYDSKRMLGDFEGKEVVVKIKDLEEKTHFIPSLVGGVALS